MGKKQAAAPKVNRGASVRMASEPLPGFAGAKKGSSTSLAKQAFGSGGDFERRGSTNPLFDGDDYVVKKAKKAKKKKGEKKGKKEEKLDLPPMTISIMKQEMPIGIRIDTGKKEGTYPKVTKVAKGGVAAVNDIQEGDLVMQMNGVNCKGWTGKMCMDQVKKHKINTRLTFEIKPKSKRTKKPCSAPTGARRGSAGMAMLDGMDEMMAEAEASKPKKKASVKKSKTGSKKETKEKKADAKAARVKVPEEPHDPDNPKTKYYHERCDVKEALAQLTAADAKESVIGRFLLREDLMAAAEKEEPDHHWVSVVTGISPVEVAHFRVEREKPSDPYQLDYKPMAGVTTLIAVVNFCRNNDMGPDLTTGTLVPPPEAPQRRSSSTRASPASSPPPTPAAAAPAPVEEATAAAAENDEEMFDGFGIEERADSPAPAGNADGGGGDGDGDDEDEAGGFGDDVSEDGGGFGAAEEEEE